MSGADRATAYQRGYAKGFADGTVHKLSREKTPFWRSFFSNRFRIQYLKGYRQGHFDGEREARNTERRKQAKKRKPYFETSQCAQAKNKRDVKDLERRADLQRLYLESPIRSERER